MKNRITYLILAFAPPVFIYLAGLILGFNFGLLLLAIYLAIYRAYLDSKRLLALGIITKSEHSKWWVPMSKSWWYPVTHFKQLYLS